MDDVSYTTVVVTSTASFFGCLFIVIVYHKFKILQVFSSKLIYILAIADGVNSMVSVIPTNLNLSDDGILCKIQGFSLQFFCLASVLWTGVIALFLYMQVILHKEDIEKYFRILLLITLSLSIIFAVIPLITRDYAYVGGWCWITARNERAIIYRDALFYAWIWLTIACIIYVYYRVIRKIKADLTFKDTFLDEGKVLVNKLMWYPLIIVICYTPITALRISQAFDSNVPIWFISFSTALKNLLGCLNAIVYGFNDSVKSEVANYLFRKVTTESFLTDTDIN